MNTNSTNKISFYLGWLYFLLSIIIFIQATIFPQKPANLLIHLIAPKFEGKSIITSPYDHVRYLNMVVYGGLAIAGTLFLQAIGIVLRYKVNNKGLIYKYIDISLTLAKLALVFICTVTIYHLYKGEEANLFTVSNESFATLAVLLICVFLSLFRRKK
jgi:hypothetical protein